MDEGKQKHSPADPHTEGLLLCQIGLIQIFTESVIQKDGSTWRYYLEDVLRAVAGVDEARQVLHGPFQVWYRDGRSVWITGTYRDGRPQDDWIVYMPDGAPMFPQDGVFH
jgi:hypothetical protein